MTQGILGKKIGMSRVFTEWGASIPVTLVDVKGCKVIGHKKYDNHHSVVLGFDDCKKDKMKKPIAGQLKEIDEGKRYIREISYDSNSELPEISSEILPSIFVPGQKIDVRGITKGKGFAGGMKRWNFRGGNATHGEKKTHRAAGSTGQCQDPGRVFKGKKMAGHMGGQNVSMQNIEILEVDDKNGILVLIGSVPGSKNGYLKITNAVKFS